MAGPQHCDSQSATSLSISWPMGTVATNAKAARHYYRDPESVLPASGPIGRSLPPDARDTGYRAGDLQLWLSESDPDGAFLRIDADVERWPREDPNRNTCS